MKAKKCNGLPSLEPCQDGPYINICEDEPSEGVGGGFVRVWGCGEDSSLQPPPGGSDDGECYGDEEVNIPAEFERRQLRSQAMQWSYAVEVVEEILDPDYLPSQDWRKRITTHEVPGTLTWGKPSVSVADASDWSRFGFAEFVTDTDTGNGIYRFIGRSRGPRTVREFDASGTLIRTTTTFEFLEPPFVSYNTDQSGGLCFEVEMTHFAYCGPSCVINPPFVPCCDRAWTSEHNEYDFDAIEEGSVEQRWQRVTITPIGDPSLPYSEDSIRIRVTENRRAALFRFRLPDSGFGWPFDETGGCVLDASDLIPVAYYHRCGAGDEVAIPAEFGGPNVVKIDGVCHSRAGSGMDLPDIPATQPDRVEGAWSSCTACDENLIPVAEFERCDGVSGVRRVEVDSFPSPPSVGQVWTVQDRCQRIVRIVNGVPDTLLGGGPFSDCAECTGLYVLIPWCSFANRWIMVSQSEYDDAVAAGLLGPEGVVWVGTGANGRKWCIKNRASTRNVTDFPSEYILPLASLAIIRAAYQMGRWFGSCAACDTSGPIDPLEPPGDPQLQAPPNDAMIAEFMARDPVHQCRTCGG